ncbi:unnamed protein product [Adineta steineri]|uniref:Serpin domain-containing protein n=1 Tax=Adineta steineri TaxID=433720 RepID=A0A815I121_9BILA|nr:unnamed protein product [Adineta steineri]
MIDNHDDVLEFPLRLSKLCLSNIRDDSACISPVAIEAAFHALSFPNKSNKNMPIAYYNYFIINKDSIKSLRKDLNEETMKYFNTEFQLHTLADYEEKKLLLNQLLKHVFEQTFLSSQKLLNQIIIESMTLISCSSLTFRPFKTEHWEQLWTLKFHTNIDLSIETEFYYTKGFFRVAFHNTFHKIEIPGQIIDGIQMKLIILLPRCSSDLVHLYANIKEYLNLPFSSAFIGVCIPKISIDIDINLNELLKNSNNSYNIGEFNEQIHLSNAYSLGRFILDMNIDKPKQILTHSIDLSPVTPWVFFANRPFLFLITYGDYYLLIGQMLGPKIGQERRKKKFSK